MERQMRDRQQQPRLPTGITGLDTILFGGLLRGAGYVIIGEPGAGKTILCNQICFCMWPEAVAHSMSRY